MRFPNHKVQIVATGDWQHPDFINSAAPFDCECHVETWPLAGEKRLKPDLILHFQAGRGAFAQHELEQLTGDFPSADLLLVAASICEGELRSGKPIKGIARCYWHQLSPRLWKWAQESNRTPLEPAVNSCDPGSVFFVERDMDNRHAGWVGISATSRSSFDMLTDTLEYFGMNSVWLESREDWTSISPQLEHLFVDSNSVDEITEQRIKKLRQFFADNPFTALMNFPRWHEVERLEREFGISSIISKPFDRAAVELALRQKQIMQTPLFPRLGGRPYISNSLKSVRQERRVG